MANRSRRRRRRGGSTQETRIRWIKILVILFVLFLPFQKETLYYLEYVWNFIKFRGQIPPGLVDTGPALGYFLNLVFGFIIYMVSLYFFAFFNAQFLLPINNWGERFQIYEHFMQFLRGNYGPLIFVRDGQEISHYGEREKPGPGVVLVNSNSAVVVGSRVQNQGVVFTGNSRIKTLFDLRKQVRSQENVTAITRDGIEIETDIFVQFSISGPPHEIFVTEINHKIQTVEFDFSDVVTDLSSDVLDEEEQLAIKKIFPDLFQGNFQQIPLANLQQYALTRFNPQRIQTVFDNQPRDPQSGKKIDWRDLPLAIAMEEFRNTIVRYPFDELFIMQDSQASRRPGQIPQYPLAILRRDFSKRMQESGKVTFYYVRSKKNRPVEIGDHRSSLYFYPAVDLPSSHPLGRSGISVTAAGFGEISPTNEEVKIQTIQNLIARWKSEAFKTEVGFDEQAALIRSRAKTQVQQDTVYALAEFLQEKDQMKTAIILRIFQALEAATADSSNPELISMVNMLSNLRRWFS